ncbi:MAG: Gfo/Idh/MocA family oxidoreductase [Candidatus Latescibacteria bacterium]|jgi:UDP-N-acetyl-2-amino-2-deoxyglucuronate dehydrogenase|nr:Gfo/Idh/MocA family oxidoreductase [Candidatus Latescibacterota bacterium]
MTAIYRAGIVGAGQIGRAHALGYQGVDSVEIVAVTEPNDRVRSEFQEQYQIPTGYTDIKEMMDQEDLDFVSICTWHLLHEPQTLLAASYLPKAIICEKPMTVGTASADRMIAECEEKHVKLVIGHQRRFYHSWTRARDLILEGVIGVPQMVTTKSGEGLLNCGTHVIDACRYLVGDPETDWVMGALERKTDRYEREVRIEDCCMALIQFEGGSQALVQSDLTPERWSVEEYQVRGTEGVLETDARSVRYLNGQTASWIELDLPTEDPWVLQAQATVAWFEGGDGHRGEARQARKAVDIMMALYQSARDHEVVRMPMEETGYPMDEMFAEGKLPVLEAGAYDIRSFLAMEPDDRARYNEMRGQGMRHKDIADAMNR